MALGAQAALGWASPMQARSRKAARRSPQAREERSTVHGAVQRADADAIRQKRRHLQSPCRASSPEPPFAHDRAPRVGVLLVNLGTPDAPTSGAVRRYLARVPCPIRAWSRSRAASGSRSCTAFILLVAARAVGEEVRGRSGRKDGSPLLVHTLRQRALLRGLLGERLKALGLPPDLCPVELGMRYGNPVDGRRDRRAARRGLRTILVLPLYPQYAASTTATALDAVAAHMREAAAGAGAALRRLLPRRSRLHQRAGAEHQRLLDEARARPTSWCCRSTACRERTLDLGDPYHCQCHATARLLARELGLAATQWRSRSSRASARRNGCSRTPATARRAGEGRQVRASTWSARASSPIASRRWRKSASRAGRCSRRQAARISTHPCLNEHPLWIAAMTDLAHAQPARLARRAAGRRRARADDWRARRRWARANNSSPLAVRPDRDMAY